MKNLFNVEIVCGSQKDCLLILTQDRSFAAAETAAMRIVLDRNEANGTIWTIDRIEFEGVIDN